ncbi:MAG: hypothetical protein ABIR70_13410 [Bryobacteraceae bacterium]
MSHFTIALILAATPLMAEGTLDPSTQPAPQAIVGNAKTVGADATPNNIQRAADRSTIANAKTVGGDYRQTAPDHKPESVGNSKTVGGR